MRIIAGRLRGRKIKAPKGLATRPVLARVREALFTILGDMNGLRFLDLYAGTGSIGIEALSRGAESAVFVEFGSVQCRVIRENLASFEHNALVIRADVGRALKKLTRQGRTFDVVFADPPYEQGLSQQTVRDVCSGELLGETGILAVTSRNSEELPEKVGAFELIDNRKYGDTKLSFYTNTAEQRTLA